MFIKAVAAKVEKEVGIACRNMGHLFIPVYTVSVLCETQLPYHLN